MEHILALTLGYVLDLLLGDPLWLPHPIVLIGKLIAALEKRLRLPFKGNDVALLYSGALLVFTVCCCTFFVPWLLLYGAGLVHPYLRTALETWFCYQILATKCLSDNAEDVAAALRDGTLAEARTKVGCIVGRDTRGLSREEVIKATVETVAENTSDGVVAPLFYMFIGGAPLAFLYKGINTMDSMIGYRTEQYLYFGRCAARLDDAVNLLPARLSALLMIAASFFCGLDAKRAWRIFKRDRYKHLSPNSAMTESVAAGALGLRLGGDHFYFGQLIHKETIGDALCSPAVEHIEASRKLLYATSLLALLCGLALWALWTSVL